MPNHMFQELEEEFVEIAEDVSKKLGTLGKFSGFEKRKVVREIEGSITEAESQIEQMELELFDIPKNLRNKYEQAIAGYKLRLKNLSTDLRKAELSAGESSSGNAFGVNEDLQGRDADEGQSNEDRQLMHDNTERLNRTTKTIRQSQRQALEIEEIGINILGNLESQGETLQRARARLDGTNAELRKSNRLALKMYREVMQNKILVYIISFILFMCICLIVYFKFLN